MLVHCLYCTRRAHKKGGKMSKIRNNIRRLCQFRVRIVPLRALNYGTIVVVRKPSGVNFATFDVICFNFTFNLIPTPFYSSWIWASLQLYSIFAHETWTNYLCLFQCQHHNHNTRDDKSKIYANYNPAMSLLLHVKHMCDSNGFPFILFRCVTIKHHLECRKNVYIFHWTTPS